MISTAIEMHCGPLSTGRARRDRPGWSIARAAARRGTASLALAWAVLIAVPAAGAEPELSQTGVATRPTILKALHLPKTGLWRQLLGAANTKPAPTTAPSVAAAAGADTNPSRSGNNGLSGSDVVEASAALANQLLGHGAGGVPPSDRSSVDAPPGPPAVPVELQLAEQQLRTSAIDGAWELWGQLALAETPVDDVAITIAAGDRPTDNLLTALWQPMNVDNPTTLSPQSVGAVGIADTDGRANMPEAERVPSLVRSMFYLTHDAADPLTPESTVAQHPVRSLEERLAETSLVRQFALSEGEDLRIPRLAPSEAVLQAEAEAWNETWTAPWLAMTSQLMLTNDPIQPPSPRGDVVQVAFQEEALPAPPPDGLDLPEDDAKGTAERDASGNADQKEESLAGAEKLGDEPEDNSLEFLRTSTVLLDPGEVQFDIGIEYSLSENDFPILFNPDPNTIAVDEVHFKGRELAVPMELRFGLLKRVQLFLQVPVGWSNTQVSFDNFDAFANDGGLGDVAWGATIQLQDATEDCPYVVATLSATAPTGGDPFTGVVGVSPSAPSLGNGFWYVAANVQVIRVYDPVVVFYGLGSRVGFEHRYVGREIEPGPEYNYTLGVGFSVNEKVTLSTQFFGAYIEEIKVDGDRVEGSNQEPISLRLAATFAKPCDRLVEPFVAFGLTDDAVSTNFGITWTF